MMDIYYTTLVTTMQWFSFLAKVTPQKMLLVDPVFDETQMQYIFIIVL